MGAFYGEESGENLMAAPRKPLDMQRVEDLARMGATAKEIADILGVSMRTIYRRCGKLLIKLDGEWHARLRGLQRKAANDGNIAMLIWLGKQELGQSEKAENTNKGQQTIVMKEGGRDSTPRGE
jgi:hypothetical protein